MAFGHKTGGRKAGTPNKKTQEQITAVINSGMSPLDYLVLTFRNDSVDASIRLDAAKAAAPYLHPRLSTSSIQIDGDPNSRPVSEWTDGELEAAIDWLHKSIAQ